jgi:hypothetical protein
MYYVRVKLHTPDFFFFWWWMSTSRIQAVDSSTSTLLTDLNVED